MGSVSSMDNAVPLFYPLRALSPIPGDRRWLEGCALTALHPDMLRAVHPDDAHFFHDHCHPYTIFHSPSTA